MENTQTQTEVTTNPENTTTTTTEPTNGAVQNPESTQGSDKTIPYERFKEVNEGLKTFKNALSELGFESVDDLKSFAQTAKTLQQQEEERKRNEMSEIERYKTDFEKAQETIQSLTNQINQTTEQVKKDKIVRAFQDKAREAGIAYVEDAYELAKAKVDTLTLDENGQVVGVEEIVKDLLANKPFLVSSAEKQPETIGESTNPAQSTQAEQKSKQEVLRQYADKARKSGRHEDMVAYMAKKREFGL